MLSIHCPHCGETRDESEFAYAGEAYIVRPNNPQQTTENAWGDYVFHRTNTKGIHYEQWQHVHGCRKIFVVARDTRNNHIHRTGTFTAMRRHYTKWQASLAAAAIPLAIASRTINKKASRKPARKSAS